jgi:hypothetical protein
MNPYRNEETAQFKLNPLLPQWNVKGKIYI